MHRTKVKASGVTNLTDARYFAAREVEWLGFPVGNGISALAAKAIAEWVDGVKVVAELDFPDAGELESVASQLGLSAIQVGMFTPVTALATAAVAVPFIKEVVPDGLSVADLTAHFAEYAPHCGLFLLNFSKAGLNWADLKKGQTIPTSALQALLAQYPTLVEMDVAAADLPEMLSALQPFGLSLSGGAEEKIGFKSFDDLDEMLDVLG